MGQVMLKRAMVVVVSMCVLGCTTQYTGALYKKTLETVNLSGTHELVRHQPWRLSVHTPIYLAKPSYPLKNNSGKQDYLRARFSLLAALESSLAQYYPSLSTSMASLSQEDAILAARKSGSRILVYPRLLAYPTETAGSNKTPLLGSYRTKFQLLIIDVDSGRVLDSGTVDSRSGIGLVEGRDTHQFLVDASELYVSSLAGVSP